MLVAVAVLLAVTTVLLGSSAAQARCVTVGADSIGQTICGLP